MLRRADIAHLVSVHRFDSAPALAEARLSSGNGQQPLALVTTTRACQNPEDVMLNWMFGPLAGDLVRLLPRHDELHVRAFACRAERLLCSMANGEFYKPMTAEQSEALEEAARSLRNLHNILRSPAGHSALDWVADADLATPDENRRLPFGWKSELVRLASAASKAMQLTVEGHRRPANRPRDHARIWLESELRSHWAAVFGKPAGQGLAGPFRTAADRVAQDLRA
jgi:hypothetical protein